MKSHYHHVGDAAADKLMSELGVKAQGDSLNFDVADKSFPWVGVGIAAVALYFLFRKK